MHDALVLQEHHHLQMQAVQVLQMPLLGLYTAPQMRLQAVSRPGVHAWGCLQEPPLQCLRDGVLDGDCSKLFDHAQAGCTGNMPEDVLVRNLTQVCHRGHYAAPGCKDSSCLP